MFILPGVFYLAGFQDKNDNIARQEELLILLDEQLQDKKNNIDE